MTGLYLPRLVDELISDLLVDLPGLLIVGPRATGKTTTARRHARSIVHLDHDIEAEQFRADPDVALVPIRHSVYPLPAERAGAVLTGLGAATSSGGGATALVPIPVDVAPRATTVPLSDPAWVARHGLTVAQYQAEFDRLTKADYRPARVSAYAIGADVRYAAIWNKSGGSPWVANIQPLGLPGLMGCRSVC